MSHSDPTRSALPTPEADVVSFAMRFGRGVVSVRVSRDEAVTLMRELDATDGKVDEWGISARHSEDDWKAAHEHLQEVRKMYVEIGAAGVLGLTLSLNPLLVRYERGERTPELLEEMRNVE